MILFFSRFARNRPVGRPGLQHFLAVAALSGLAATATADELPTFVELPSGFVIGAHTKGEWFTSEMSGKALEAGRKYRLFTLSGEIGEATGGKAAPDLDLCPEVWVQTFAPAIEKQAIAVSAPWNPLPRTAKAADATQEVYVKAVREFLIGKGIRNPVVKVTQHLRVDLDGDGEEEVLLSATHYSGKEEELLHSPAAGNYSCVLLRRVVRGKVQTSLIQGEFHLKANSSATPNRHEILGLLDLSGDGRLEIIVQAAYYEGATLTVWHLAPDRLRKALEFGCGA